MFYSATLSIIFVFFQRWQSASKIEKKKPSVFFNFWENCIFFYIPLFIESSLVKRAGLLSALRENGFYSVFSVSIRRLCLIFGGVRRRRRCRSTFSILKIRFPYPRVQAGRYCPETFKRDARIGRRKKRKRRSTVHV